MRSHVETRVSDRAPDRAGAARERAPWRYLMWLVAGAFVVSRLIAYVAGVRFDGSFLSHAWQYLDLPWLREDLTGSLIHLHSQPPLFNLFLGVAAKVAPGDEALVFQIGYLALGLLAALAMLDLLRRLGVRPGLATGATLLFVLSPAALLYENWLFYMYPLALVLVLTAWSLCRYGERPSVARGVVAFGLLAVPALTWPLFHLGWLVGVAVALAVVWRAGARRTLVLACLPLLLVTGWYVKTLVMFDEFSASTWSGINLFRVTTAELSSEELQGLVDGPTAGVAAIRTFSPPEEYADHVTIPPPTGVRVLDAPRKADGTPNYNHLAQIAIAERYGDAAVTALRERPDAYAAAVAKGACRYLLPSSDYWALDDNRSHVTVADRLYNAVVYGQLRPAPEDSGCRLRYLGAGEFPLLFPLLFAGSLLGAGWLALRRGEDARVRVVLGFVAVTLAWVTFAGNAFEFGENNRFRFVTEPLMWVAIAVVVDRVLSGLRARAGRRGEAAPQERRRG